VGQIKPPKWAKCSCQTHPSQAQQHKKDLVLLPNHLWKTIHESIGHSTELDRALGYEANFAGTSFLTVSKMGKERVGTEIINVWGDRTAERGLATVGYDDDGVKTSRFPIIEKASSRIFRRFVTKRTWCGRRSRGGALMPTPGPVCRSSECRTFPWILASRIRR
jgi:hypothetical protein